MSATKLAAEAGCYIAGSWQPGRGQPIRLMNPSLGEEIGEALAGDSRQVEAALVSSRSTFDAGSWERVAPLGRSRLLHRLADLIERDREMLAQLIATEVGTPISLARTLQVDSPIEFLRWYAEAALRGPGGGLEQPLPVHRVPVMSSSVLRRVPVGVVAAITAYNYPLQLAVWKIGPALASGCTVVLLPSPKALLSTVALVQLIEEAGFPPGAVNFVFGPPEIGEQIVTSPLVDMVSFTGSEAVGVRIMALAARTVKKVVLELGGKSPNILLPGVDVSSTVENSVMRLCRNAGQGCGVTSRTLVPAASFDQFVAEAAEFMSKQVVGSPHDEATVVGPLISGEHLTKVEGIVDRARGDGARVVTGGRRPEHLNRGWYYEPTIVTGVSNAHEISRDELFAPVSVVLPYETVDEAVAIANDSRYGLNANVWGPTPQALEFAGRLRTGTVTINGGGGFRTDAPWGGFKASGLGRENGEEGLREFYEVVHIQWPI